MTDTAITGVWYQAAPQNQPCVQTPPRAWLMGLRNQKPACFEFSPHILWAPTPSPPTDSISPHIPTPGPLLRRPNVSRPPGSCARLRLSNMINSHAHHWSCNRSSTSFEAIFLKVIYNLKLKWLGCRLTKNGSEKHCKLCEGKAFVCSREAGTTQELSSHDVPLTCFHFS